jgi:hypothetical protein
MRSNKVIAILFSAFVFVMSFALSSTEVQAQRVVRVYRPIVRPYYHSWGWRDPFWRSSWLYDPYMYDPYLREQRDRYYLQKDVKDAQKKIAKDREKYMKDGVIDAKEQEKLLSAERKYNERLAKLEKFNRDH